LEPTVPVVGDEQESSTQTTVLSEVNGKRYEVKLFLPEGLNLNSGSGQSKTKSKPRAQQSSIKTTATGHIAVPMQGTVVKVHVNVGDTVKSGETVITLEAMKMENAIASDTDGVVKEVKVKAGDALSPGDVVAIIE
jgi:acetyl-CoA/propionyl-CoA carboxylase biotin carboxyl carrier protein